MKNLSQPDSSIWTKQQKSVSHVPPASGQSPIETAAQKLADCFNGKVIQPDLEQWIGKNVKYQGRDCLLVDYLPVSGYCQIESGGKILLVPCTEISKALDCPF
jgi:hypothetical protein